MNGLPHFVTETESVWDVLQRETRPIALYGMGDGAEKILRVCEQRNIKIAGIFASDEFVRGHSFAGYLVRKRSDLEAELGDFVAVIAFASSRPEVLQLFDDLDSTHTTYAPDVPVADGALFDLDFVKEHCEELEQAYALLADDHSREVFAATVNFKLSGRLHWLRDYTDSRNTAFVQYLKPHGQEHFVDLGAYNGDTIRELLGYTDGQYASITALEPDRKTFKKLKKYVEQAGLDRIQLVNAGAWDKPGEMLFAGKAGRNSVLTPVMHEISHDRHTVSIPVESVDHVLHGTPCTMLKLDVEGAERMALEGARNTIQTYRPKISLSAYHRSEDLYELPLLLYDMCPDVKIGMLHHPYVPAWETNFYVTFG
ncbi:MAG: FkbM family methyltransferase [Clostridia bacterium]|nr:FkbM family methyltransferase [Clostridia bacterium]